MDRISRLGPVLALLLGALLGGCSSPPNEVRDTSSPVITDKTLYIARPAVADCTETGCSYTFTVKASYTNHTDRPLYLARCYPDSPTPIYGVRLIAPRGEGEAAYNLAWGCVGHDEAIEVLPGETRTDTLDLWGPNAFDGETGEPYGELEGDFQLNYQVQICPEEDVTCGLVYAAGSSNLFEVRLAR